MHLEYRGQRGKMRRRAEGNVPPPAQIFSIWDKLCGPKNLWVNYVWSKKPRGAAALLPPGSYAHKVLRKQNRNGGGGGGGDTWSRLQYQNWK